VVMAERSSLLVVIMLATSKTIKQMAKVHSRISQEENMKATGKKISNTAKVKSTGRAVLQSMTVILIQVRNMVMENSHGVMVPIMMANSQMDCFMALVSIILRRNRKLIKEDLLKAEWKARAN